MTQYYVKKGRKFQPVDLGFFDTGLLPEGAYLLHVKKNGQSLTRDIRPDFEALIAAGIIVRDKIQDAIYKATEARPPKDECSPEELKAWEEFKAKTHYHYVEYPSVHEIADSILFALCDEADKLLKYDTLREAHDQFIMLCNLTREQQGGNNN